MQNAAYKLKTFLELMQIMESAFVFKLRKNNPSISDEEIKSSIADWYASKPMFIPAGCEAIHKQ